LNPSRDWMDGGIDLLWGLTLFFLPVTSFPYFPLLGRDTQVRPLSFFPLLLCLPLLVIQAWRRKTKLWKHAFTPLSIFILALVITSAAGFFLAPPEVHGQDYTGRMVRAFLTLAIGLAFLLLSAWSLTSRERLIASLKWLYLGLFLTFLWGMVQLAVFKGWILNEDILDAMQKQFSISGISLKNLRIPGFTFEPSWLAAQAAIFYFPWLYASWLTGLRVTRWRWLEAVLGAMAIFLILFSYSRSGLLMVLATGLLVGVIAGKEKLAQAWQWFRQPFMKSVRKTVRSWKDWLRRLGLVFILLLALGSGLMVLSRNPYFSKIWHSRKTDPVGYIIDIYAGPRLAYLWSGMATFNQHPWLGVGLGASGFHLRQNFPDWSLNFVPEVTLYFSPRNTSFPNIKNMFVRLLAESGMIGFGAFVAFLLYTLGLVLEFRKGNGQVARFLWVAGLSSWLVIVLFFFTQDSLAMPNNWINLGMLMGAIEWAVIPAAGLDHPQPAV